jgi:sulfopyruvate decarboxylase TPP-binding subunit
MPILLLITMRGEWGEFNPWQVPMGSQVQAALEMMGLQVMRADTAPDVAPMVKAAARQVFEGGGAVAVLLSQRLIGAKDFNKEAAK